ncbi:hypothetical protein BGZ73_003172 [Actinomortierella ambigua]|nr:hypothetical protein BGZ73_003172 [Actinomortierella ambigua]
MQQHGQTLLINSPSPGGNSPKGSLSNRFAKIAQSRQKAGVVVVGSGGIESRPGKSLGLGFGTGIPPSQFQANGQRISTKGRGGPGGVSTGMPTASIGKGGKILGIQTQAGLARAMQEKGGGAPERLLMNPNQPIVREARGPARRKGAPLRGVGGAPERRAPPQQQQPQPQQTRSSRPTRGSPYAAAAASRKGVKKSLAPSQGARQPQARTQPQSQAAAGADKSKGKKGKSKAKPAKATPDSLDSDLTAYMMKSNTTASAILDNDLDTYMAEKPDDLTF